MVRKHGVDELEWVLLREPLIRLVELEFILLHFLRGALPHRLRDGELSLPLDLCSLVHQILPLLANEAARCGALQVLSHGRIVIIQLVLVPVHVLVG